MTAHDPKRSSKADPGDGATEHELLAQFRSGSLPPAEMTHEAHVRLGWLYLRASPPLRAMEAFCTDLVHYTRAVGAEGRYHETITWAYLLVIRQRIARAPEADWSTFASANPDLLAGGAAFLRGWYSDEALASPFARRCFVMPERREP